MEGFYFVLVSKFLFSDNVKYIILVNRLFFFNVIVFWVIIKRFRLIYYFLLGVLGFIK